MRKTLATAALLLTVLTTAADGKKHVNIFNYLYTGDRQLTVQCHSGDGDMELRTLGYTDDYSWSFDDNDSLTTLFWCHLTADNESKYIRFNAYQPGWHVPSLEWIARDDGISYIRRVPGYKETLVHPWIFG
ncbi:hypothetical protein LINPERHAP2_LOCUS6291 [Linum perenne]